MPSSAARGQGWRLTAVAGALAAAGAQVGEARINPAAGQHSRDRLTIVPG